MHLLPSDIARLVLGYLKDKGLKKTFVAFLQESPDLSEYWRLLNFGQRPTTTVMGHTLKSVLEEYAALTVRVKALTSRLEEISVAQTSEDSSPEVEPQDIDGVVESHRKEELDRNRRNVRQRKKRKCEVTPGLSQQPSSSWHQPSSLKSDPISPQHQPSSSQTEVRIPTDTAQPSNSSKSVNLGSNILNDVDLGSNNSNASHGVEDLDDEFEFDSLDKILADTKLHEKLAESINKALKKEQATASLETLHTLADGDKKEGRITDQGGGYDQLHEGVAAKVNVEDIISMTAAEPGLEQLLSLFQFQSDLTCYSSPTISNVQSSQPPTDDGTNNSGATLYLPSFKPKQPSDISHHSHHHLSSHQPTHKENNPVESLHLQSSSSSSYKDNKDPTCNSSINLPSQHKNNVDVSGSCEIPHLDSQSHKNNVDVSGSCEIPHLDSQSHKNNVDISGSCEIPHLDSQSNLRNDDLSQQPSASTVVAINSNIYTQSSSTTHTSLGLCVSTTNSLNTNAPSVCYSSKQSFCDNNSTTDTGKLVTVQSQRMNDECENVTLVSVCGSSITFPSAVSNKKSEASLLQNSIAAASSIQTSSKKSRIKRAPKKLVTNVNCTAENIIGSRGNESTSVEINRTAEGIIVDRGNESTNTGMIDRQEDKTNVLQGEDGEKTKTKNANQQFAKQSIESKNLAENCRVDEGTRDLIDGIRVDNSFDESESEKQMEKKNVDVSKEAKKCLSSSFIGAELSLPPPSPVFHSMSHKECLTGHMSLPSSLSHKAVKDHSSNTVNSHQVVSEHSVTSPSVPPSGNRTLPDFSMEENSLSVFSLIEKSVAEITGETFIPRHLRDQNTSVMKSVESKVGESRNCETRDDKNQENQPTKFSSENFDNIVEKLNSAKTEIKPIESEIKPIPIESTQEKTTVELENLTSDSAATVTLQEPTPLCPAIPSPSHNTPLHPAVPSPHPPMPSHNTPLHPAIPSPHPQTPSHNTPLHPPVPSPHPPTPSHNTPLHPAVPSSHPPTQSHDAPLLPTPRTNIRHIDETNTSFDNCISTPDRVYVRPIGYLDTTLEKNIHVVDTCLQNIFGGMQPRSVNNGVRTVPSVGNQNNDGHADVVEESIEEGICSTMKNEENTQTDQRESESVNIENNDHVDEENNDDVVEKQSGSEDVEVVDGDDEHLNNSFADEDNKDRNEKMSENALVHAVLKTKDVQKSANNVEQNRLPSHLVSNFQAFNELQGSATIGTPFVQKDEHSSPIKLSENVLKMNESASMPASLPSRRKNKHNDTKIVEESINDFKNVSISTSSSILPLSKQLTPDKYAPYRFISDASRRIISHNIDHSPFIPSHLKKSAPSRRITPMEVSFSTPSPLQMMSPSSPADFVIDLAPSPSQPSTPAKELSANNSRNNWHIAGTGESPSRLQGNKTPTRCVNKNKNFDYSTPIRSTVNISNTKSTEKEADFNKIFVSSDNSVCGRRVDTRDDLPEMKNLVIKVKDKVSVVPPGSTDNSAMSFHSIASRDSTQQTRLPSSCSSRKPRRVIPTLISRTVSKGGSDSFLSPPNCSQTGSMFGQDESKIVSSSSDPPSPHTEAEAFRLLKNFISQSYTKPQPNQEITSSNNKTGTGTHRHSSSVSVVMQKCGCLSREVCTHVKGKGRKSLKKYGVGSNKDKEIGPKNRRELDSNVKTAGDVGLDDVCDSSSRNDVDGGDKVTDDVDEKNDAIGCRGSGKGLETNHSSESFIPVGTVFMNGEENLSDNNADDGIQRQDKEMGGDLSKDHVTKNLKYDGSTNVDCISEHVEIGRDRNTGNGECGAQVERITNPDNSDDKSDSNTDKHLNSHDSSHNSNGEIKAGRENLNLIHNSIHAHTHGEFDNDEHHENISLAAPYFPELSTQNVFDLFKFGSHKKSNSGESGSDYKDSNVYESPTVTKSDLSGVTINGGDGGDSAFKLKIKTANNESAQGDQPVGDQGECLLSLAMKECGIPQELSDLSLMGNSQMGSGFYATNQEMVQTSAPMSTMTVSQKSMEELVVQSQTLHDQQSSRSPISSKQIPTNNVRITRSKNKDSTAKTKKLKPIVPSPVAIASKASVGNVANLTSPNLVINTTNNAPIQTLNSSSLSGQIAYLRQPNQQPIPFMILPDGKLVVMSDSSPFLQSPTISVQTQPAAFTPPPPSCLPPPPSCLPPPPSCLPPPPSCLPPPPQPSTPSSSSVPEQSSSKSKSESKNSKPVNVISKSSKVVRKKSSTSSCVESLQKVAMRRKMEDITSSPKKGPVSTYFRNAKKAKGKRKLSLTSKAAPIENHDLQMCVNAKGNFVVDSPNRSSPTTDYDINEACLISHVDSFVKEKTKCVDEASVNSDILNDEDSFDLRHVGIAKDGVMTRPDHEHSKVNCEDVLRGENVGDNDEIDNIRVNNQVVDGNRVILQKDSVQCQESMEKLDGSHRTKEEERISHPVIGKDSLLNDDENVNYNECSNGLDDDGKMGHNPTKSPRKGDKQNVIDDGDKRKLISDKPINSREILSVEKDRLMTVLSLQQSQKKVSDPRRTKSKDKKHVNNAESNGVKENSEFGLTDKSPQKISISDSSREKCNHPSPTSENISHKPEAKDDGAVKDIIKSPVKKSTRNCVSQKAMETGSVNTKDNGDGAKVRNSVSPFSSTNKRTGKNNSGKPKMVDNETVTSPKKKGLMDAIDCEIKTEIEDDHSDRISPFSSRNQKNGKDDRNKQTKSISEILKDVSLRFQDFMEEREFDISTLSPVRSSKKWKNNTNWRSPRRKRYSSGDSSTWTDCSDEPISSFAKVVKDGSVSITISDEGEKIENVSDGTIPLSELVKLIKKECAGGLRKIKKGRQEVVDREKSDSEEVTSDITTRRRKSPQGNEELKTKKVVHLIGENDIGIASDLKSRFSPSGPREIKSARRKKLSKNKDNDTWMEDSKKYVETGDTSKSLESIKKGDTSKSFEPKKKGDTSKSLESIKKGDTSKSLESIKKGDTSKSLESIKKGDTSKSLESIKKGDTSKSLESIKKGDTSKSLESINKGDTSKSLESIKKGDTSKSLESIKKGDTSKSLESIQKGDTSKSLESMKKKRKGDHIESSSKKRKTKQSPQSETSVGLEIHKQQDIVKKNHHVDTIKVKKRENNVTGGERNLFRDLMASPIERITTTKPDRKINVHENGKEVLYSVASNRTATLKDINPDTSKSTVVHKSPKGKKIKSRTTSVSSPSSSITTSPDPSVNTLQMQQSTDEMAATVLSQIMLHEDGIEYRENSDICSLSEHQQNNTLTYSSSKDEVSVSSEGSHNAVPSSQSQEVASSPSMLLSTPIMSSQDASIQSSQPLSNSSKPITKRKIDKLLNKLYKTPPGGKS